MFTTTRTGRGVSSRRSAIDLGRLAVADPRVDEEDARVAEDDADVLVVERVSPDEYAVADLGPTRTCRAA